MPRPLSEYAWNDYLHLRPLLHAIKEARYRRIDRWYSSQPCRRGDVTPIQADLTGRNVVVTIAFNDTQALDWHLTLTGKYLGDVVRVVGDNSPTSESAEQIEQLCQQHQVHYLRLPENPWSGRNGSRSHGLAMNWMWRRVLRPGQPSAFGFLDHDLFPLGPDDPFALLSEVDFHGDQRVWGPRWFLWAGYCFFRFEAVRCIPLDFGLDWTYRLDTGGANWQHLYRHVDPASLPKRTLTTIPVFDDIPWRDACFETRGNWIHEVGVMGEKHLRHAKRERLTEMLRPHLAVSATASA